MIKKLLAPIILFFTLQKISIAQDMQHVVNPDAVNPNWQAEVPSLIHPNEKLVKLYNKTWEIAAGRVRKGPDGIIASPYLDENCYDDQIWIWDGCFMTMFAKYAPNSYPLTQTLMNYYVPILDSTKTPLRIHWLDNPPLFAWIEHDSYQFTNNEQHANMVVNKLKYLQRHFDFFNSVPSGFTNYNISPNPVHKNVVYDDQNKIIGYTWSGVASGMDNTPRGLDCGGYDKIMWIDAIAQQALSALYISRLSEKLNYKAEAKKWKAIYEDIKKTINDRYWDEEDGFYYDIEISTGKPCKVKSMASYWVLLAEVASPSQAERMVEILKDEKYFGVKYPFTSLSRDNKYFNAETGDYWRGGIWLPMAYMGTKALEKYGYYDLAYTLANNIVQQQLRTYFNYTPNTIWEAYNPNKDEPTTEYSKIARPEFCGWSALGPISLTIENILGFRVVDATKKTIVWDLRKENQTHGIKGLKFGEYNTDIKFNHLTNVVSVTSNKAYTLHINKKKFKIKKGTNSFKYKS